MDLRDFIQKHSGGCPAIPINEGSTYLLRDGAQYTGSDPLMMLFAEPPMDPKENLRAQKRYLVAAINFEIAAFQKFKAECDLQDTYAIRYLNWMPSGPQATEQLRQGKARIEGLQKELAAIESQIGEPQQPPAAQIVQEQINRRNETIRAEMANRAAL